MDLNQIIVNVMVGIMALAALDRCFGNRFGLGGQIDAGLDTFSSMCIPMVGMILLAPIIGSFLGPVISPFFQMMGADPAMFPGAILACDMGGYSLAQTMAMTQEAADLSGCILGCSLGGAISFIIPVGINIVQKEYHSYFALGVLIGIITVPLGLAAGGIYAGYQFSMVARNTLPVLLFSLLIALGLWRAQKVTIMIFKGFGYLLTAISTAGFAIGIIQELTPVVIIPGLASVLEGIQVVGSVVIVLCGAYPMLQLIKRLIGQSLQKLGLLLGLDSNATVARLGGFANIMPILGTCNTMSPAGVVVAVAFAVSGSCMFGDHLGFIAGVDRTMIIPMILSKMVGSFSAVALATYVCKRGKIPGGGTFAAKPEQQ